MSAFTDKKRHIMRKMACIALFRHKKFLSFCFIGVDFYAGLGFFGCGLCYFDDYVGLTRHLIDWYCACIREIEFDVFNK